MTRPKPIIGLAGGIGSGKTFVARLMAREGCLVLDSDEFVREAYQRADVRQTLRQWWGNDVFLPDGSINRSAIAAKVFADPADRRRLEALIHPLVAKRRDQVMDMHRNDPSVRAFVWDVPLLFETGLNLRCDAVIFVDAPADERLRRVQAQRGWNQVELDRREKSQWPLDKKRQMSDHILSSSADAGEIRDQIRNVLSLILPNICG